VELITNETNMIKFTTGYLQKGDCKLDECEECHVSFENSFSNL